MSTELTAASAREKGGKDGVESKELTEFESEICCDGDGDEEGEFVSSDTHV